MCESAICTDLLPARPSYCRGAGLTFHTVTRVLALTTDVRSDRRYAVAELVRPALGGRAFQLTKLAAGTDAEADGYAAFVADQGPGWDSCECRGFLRHGHCSHLDGVRTVIGNGWLELPAERPATPAPTADELDDEAARAEADVQAWLARHDAEIARIDARHAAYWAERALPPEPCPF